MEIEGFRDSGSCVLGSCLCFLVGFKVKGVGAWGGCFPVRFVNSGPGFGSLLPQG